MLSIQCSRLSATSFWWSNFTGTNPRVRSLVLYPRVFARAAQSSPLLEHSTIISRSLGDDLAYVFRTKSSFSSTLSRQIGHIPFPSCKIGATHSVCTRWRHGSKRSMAFRTIDVRQMQQLSETCILYATCNSTRRARTLASYVAFFLEYNSPERKIKWRFLESISRFWNSFHAFWNTNSLSKIHFTDLKTISFILVLKLRFCKLMHSFGNKTFASKLHFIDLAFISLFLNYNLQFWFTFLCFWKLSWDSEI